MTEVILSVQEVTHIPGPIQSLSYLSFSGFKVTTNEQEIFLLISDGQECCEDHGYFVCDDDFQAFIGANLVSISAVNKELCKTVVWEKLSQKCGMKTLPEYPNALLDEGDVMFVEIMTNRGPFQFAAYNAHNGYYGHSALVVSKQLSYEAAL